MLDRSNAVRAGRCLHQYRESRNKVNNAADGGIVIDVGAFRAFLSGVGAAKMTDENTGLSNGFFVQSNERTKECWKTNYYGTKAVTEALLPFNSLIQEE